MSDLFELDADLIASIIADEFGNHSVEGIPGMPAELEGLVNAEIESNLGTAEGLFGPPEADPNLPEIVLLHGITDCHLANEGGLASPRIWLSMRQLLLGRFTRSLTVQDDGFSDAPGTRFVTDGYLKKKYKKAVDSWREEGFKVSVFQYDWRKSITKSAAELHKHLSELETVAAGKKAVLACHSMGGLVAATFASQFEDWEDLVEHCVFAGSPLSGSYSSPWTMLGLAESIQKLDKLSLSESLEDFRKMVTSFPGLIDMLPNPNVFPEAAVFYERDKWPDEIRPAASLLENSASLKNKIWESPIYAKSTHLVSQGHATIFEMPLGLNGDDAKWTTNGDGAVLTKSSAAPGLPLYLVAGTHGQLYNSESVISAVATIGRKDPLASSDISTDLDSFSPSRAAGLFDLEEESSEGLSDDSVAFIQDSVLAPDFLIQNRGEREEQVRTFELSPFATPEFSFEKALELAKASRIAYEVSHVKARAAMANWNFTESSFIDINETQGFVCSDSNNIIISYRGSEKKVKDWLRNFDIESIATEGYGKVHKGFYEAYHETKNQLRNALEQAKQDNPSKGIWITGHSLGGAIATIAAAELFSTEKIHGVYTYGQPKLGRSALQNLIEDELPDKFFRFVCGKDIVTKIPPNFKHVGEYIWLDDEVKAAGLINPDKEAVETEMTEEQFEQIRTALKNDTELRPEGLIDLPFDDLLISGFSVKDHSLVKKYIPALEKRASA